MCWLVDKSCFLEKTCLTKKNLSITVSFFIRHHPRPRLSGFLKVTSGCLSPNLNHHFQVLPDVEWNWDFCELVLMIVQAKLLMCASEKGLLNLAENKQYFTRTLFSSSVGSVFLPVPSFPSLWWYIKCFQCFYFIHFIFCNTFNCCCHCITFNDFFSEAGSTFYCSEK